MTKKEKLIAFNRQNILDAAKQLFAENGIDKTSMDDISKLADYSKSTVYVYFKSKDEIYFNIVLDYMNLLYKGLTDCIQSQEDIKACYHLICKTLIDFEANYPMYFDCILGKISIKEDDFITLPVLKEIYNIGEKINELVISFFKKAIELKVINADIRLLPTVFMLWSSICSLISTSANKVEYIETHMNMSRDEYLQYSFDLLFQSIQRRDEL